MKPYSIHNIPMRIRLGCLGILLTLLTIIIILLVGFVQVFSFLIDSWIGIVLFVILILYIVIKKIIPAIFMDLNSKKKNNNFTEAEYIEIEDDNDNKSDK